MGPHYPSSNTWHCLGIDTRRDVKLPSQVLTSRATVRGCEVHPYPLPALQTWTTHAHTHPSPQALPDCDQAVFWPSLLLVFSFHHFLPEANSQSPPWGQGWRRGHTQTVQGDTRLLEDHNPWACGALWLWS